MEYIYVSNDVSLTLSETDMMAISNEYHIQRLEEYLRDNFVLLKEDARLLAEKISEYNGIYSEEEAINKAYEELDIPKISKDDIILYINTTIYIQNREKAEKVLIDNGISEDEVQTVLQALGYALLDTELYPEEV